jgi:hypothetical protein
MPTPLGEYWLEPAPYVVGSGVFDANGQLRLIDPIGQLVPPGMVVATQCVIVDPSGIRLSLPAIAPRGL